MVVPTLDNPMDPLWCPKKRSRQLCVFHYFENTFVRAWARMWCTLSGQSSLSCSKLQLMKNVALQDSNMRVNGYKKGAGACRACAWRARTAYARAVKGRSVYAMLALAIQVTVLFVGVRSVFVCAKHSLCDPSTSTNASSNCPSSAQCCGGIVCVVSAPL